MGTKRSIRDILEGTEKNISVPPGFVSLTALSFKKTKNPGAANAKDVGQEFIKDSLCASYSNSGIATAKAAFFPRPLIRHHQSDHLPQELETEQTQIETEHGVTGSLPKGVIRGCPNCQDCVKVNARCRPEDSCLPEVDDAPVFHPTEEEFKDTLKYITEIRPQAEKFGLCRIVPPSSWKPPCLLNDRRKHDPSKFNTQVQRVDGLKDFYLERKLTSMHEKIEAEGPDEIGPDFSMQSFKKYADDFKNQYFCKNGKAVDPELEVLPGPLIARIEGEYWRIIENPTEEVEVLFGTDLGSQTLRSGFPVRDSQAEKSPYSEYVESGWNLNNTPKLPCSLLPYGCHEKSKIMDPQLFVGMCFASQCWRCEDHHLYSLSYMHLGDPKVWYGVPGSYWLKFMDFVRKLFPQLSKHRELLHKLVNQISPSMLKSEGIPVYRCVQNSSEFILVFPGAYHSEFSCGFNCSEAVCFAPLDWLPHGQSAVQLYSVDCQKTSISHDMLLLQAATAAVRAEWTFMVSQKTVRRDDQLWRTACRKDGKLTQALRARVKLESTAREYLCTNVPGSQSQMVNEVDSATKMECSICLCDLYLSAVGCSCSPNRYTCLLHAKNLCSCAWRARRFLFRHTIAELNLLVEALEGTKLEAIRNWAKKSKTGAITSVMPLENVGRRNTDSAPARNQSSTTNIENGRPVVRGASNENTEVPSNTASVPARNRISPTEIENERPVVRGARNENTEVPPNTASSVPASNQISPTEIENERPVVRAVRNWISPTDIKNDSPVVRGASNERTKVPPNVDVVVLSDDEDE